MPKMKITKKLESGAIMKYRPQHKMRIGTRKSGKSAHMYTTADLLNLLDNSNYKRHRSKIRRVLALRK